MFLYLKQIQTISIIEFISVYIKNDSDSDSLLTISLTVHQY